MGVCEREGESKWVNNVRHAGHWQQEYPTKRSEKKEMKWTSADDNDMQGHISNRTENVRSEG